MGIAAALVTFGATACDSHSDADRDQSASHQMYEVKPDCLDGQASKAFVDLVLQPVPSGSNDFALHYLSDEDSCATADQVLSIVKDTLPGVRGDIDKTNAIQDANQAKVDAYLHTLTSIPDARQRLLQQLKNECSNSNAKPELQQGSIPLYIYDRSMVSGTYSYFSSPWSGDAPTVAADIVSYYRESMKKPEQGSVSINVGPTSLYLTLPKPTATKPIYGKEGSIDLDGQLVKMYADLWKTAYAGVKPEFVADYSTAISQMCGPVDKHSQQNPGYYDGPNLPPGGPRVNPAPPTPIPHG